MTALDTGVIHQHINGADVLFDMFNGGINFMFMSNIKRCGNGLNTLGGVFLQQVLRVRQ